MSKNTVIDGIAASEHLDSSGESLSIEGMDISSLGGPDSILNWEHGSKDKPSQVVGKVTFARKIFKKEDAKNKRESYFWNKVKKPFVYIKAELFDGLGHSGAQDVAALLKYKNKDKGEDSRLVVGFSIEGGKMDKKGMIVTKSIARDVAITVKPCNKVCDAELIDGDVSDDFLYKNQAFDCEILEKGNYNANSMSLRGMILSDIKKSDNSAKQYQDEQKEFTEKYGAKGDREKGNKKEQIADLANDKIKRTKSKKKKKMKTSFDDTDGMKTGESIYHLKDGGKSKGKVKGRPNWEAAYKTENNMRKALVAGIMGGAPSSMSGVAALTPENLEGKMQSVCEGKKKRKKMKKSEDDEGTFLEHYSPHAGLKSINPDKMGSGVDRRTRGRSLDNKMSFFYPHGYNEPESLVNSGAKSKYTVKLPSDFKIFDNQVHGNELIEASKDKNNGIFAMDHFIDTLKENGYHGFKSRPSGLEMVGMFHELDVHSEENK
jgi:hypothetical protein